MYSKCKLCLNCKIIKLKNKIYKYILKGLLNRLIVWIILWARIGLISCECPRKEILNPCICSNELLECNGIKVKNLKTVFYELSISSYPVVKYRKIELKNIKGSELTENIFNEITFNTIYINNNEFTKIDSKAFAGTELTTTELIVRFCPLLDTSNLFDLINRFLNIREIDLREINLEAIPDNAFYKLKYLSSLTIIDTKFKTLGQKVFANLRRFQILKIMGKYFNKIHKNRFVFSENPNLPLNITMECKQTYNRFNFEEESLDSIGRPTNIKCYANPLRPQYYQADRNDTYIFDQTVFEPYFASNDNNRILLQEPKRFCDYDNNYWIINNTDLMSRISGFSNSDAQIICEN